MKLAVIVRSAKKKWLESRVLCTLVARLTLLLSLLSTPFAAVSALETVVIELGYRTAAEILPVIKPLIVAPGVATGLNSTVIIKGTAEEIVVVREIISSLDKTPKNLMVSVSHSLTDSLQEHGGSISSTVKIGDKTVTTYGNFNNQSNINVYSTRSKSGANEVQHVRVLEGREAFIRFGESVPVGHSTLHIYAGGSELHESVTYRAIDRGFYVRPRLQGDTVYLAITPFRDKQRQYDSGVDTQYQTTTVSTGLSEWIQIGGVSNDSSQTDSGILYSTRASNEAIHNIYLKVDLVN